MAVSALTNFTLYTNRTPKISHSVALNSLKIHNVSSSSSSSLCSDRRQPVGELHGSLKSLVLPFLSPPRKNISKFFVEKIATILLGSLIVMGGLKSSPVLAAPVQQSGSFEVKEDAQSGGITDNEDEEEIMCAKLLEEDPESVEALKLAVAVKMRRGKTDEAAMYVRRLIPLVPDQMEWRILQASCYEVMGNWAKARALFKKILKMNPLWAKAFHDLTLVMQNKEEGPAVFEMLQEALQVARRQKRANLERNIRFLIAQVIAMEGNWEQASKWFQNLMFENPRDFRPYVCQAVVYTQMDKGKEAEEMLEMGKSVLPEGSLQRKFLDSIDLKALKIR